MSIRHDVFAGDPSGAEDAEGVQPDEDRGLERQDAGKHEDAAHTARVQHAQESRIEKAEGN